MGLLDAISGGLTAGTKAVAANEEGKIHGSALLRAIQMQQLDREAKQSTISMNNARGRNFNSEADERANPKSVYDANRGVLVNPRTATSTPVAGLPDKPIPPKYTPHPFMEDGRPVQGLVDEGGKYLHADGTPATGRITPFSKPEKEPAPQLVTSVGPDGKPVYGAFDKGSKTIRKIDSSDLSPKVAGGGALSGPIAAKVGQFGEMLKKTHDLLNAQEALEVSLPNSAAQDVAAHGVQIPLIHAHIPGTQGLGSMAVNKTPEYSTYQAALTPLILAAAHAISGARINNEQIEQIRQSIEIKPGESKPSRAQKLKNLMDLTNSISGALPADAVAAQEGQMDPQQIAKLKAHGYKGAGHTTPRIANPRGQPAGDVDLRTPSAPKGKTYTFGGVTYQVPE